MKNLFFLSVAVLITLTASAQRPDACIKPHYVTISTDACESRIYVIVDIGGNEAADKVAPGELEYNHVMVATTTADGSILECVVSRDLLNVIQNKARRNGGSCKVAALESQCINRPYGVLASDPQSIKPPYNITRSSNTKYYGLIQYIL